MQKEKESLLKKALKILTPSLFAIAVMVASFGCFSMVANAEETTTFSYWYEFTYNENRYHVTFESKYEFVAYMTESGIDSNGNSYTSYDGGFIDPNFVQQTNNWNNIKVYLNGDPRTSAIECTDIREVMSGHFWNSFIGLSTNIPIFGSLESARAYANTGDDSGQLNKPPVVESNVDFSLKNFGASVSGDPLYIHAGWDGVNGLYGGSIFTDFINVEIKPTYFIKLNTDEEMKDFAKPATVTIPLSDYYFETAYRNYMFDCPYENCWLYLDFTPVFYDELNNRYIRGQGTTISISPDGKIEDYILPDSAKSLNYDSGCMFSSPYCNYNESDMRYYIGWEHVTHSFDVVSSSIRIDLITVDGCYTYSTNDFTWNESFIVLNRSDVDKFLIANDSSISLNSIRIIPYYKSTFYNFYGNSMLINVNGYSSVEDNIYMSTTDPYFDPDCLLYQPYPKDDPIIVDGITPSESTENDSTFGGFNFENIMSNFFTMISALLSSAGRVPSLVSKVFSFLPGVYSSMIMTALIICIILRVLGR